MGNRSVSLVFSTRPPPRGHHRSSSLSALVRRNSYRRKSGLSQNNPAGGTTTTTTTMPDLIPIISRGRSSAEVQGREPSSAITPHPTPRQSLSSSTTPQLLQPAISTSTHYPSSSPERHPLGIPPMTSTDDPSGSIPRPLTPPFDEERENSASVILTATRTAIEDEAIQAAIAASLQPVYNQQQVSLQLVDDGDGETTLPHHWADHRRAHANPRRRDSTAMTDLELDESGLTIPNPRTTIELDWSEGARTARRMFGIDDSTPPSIHSSEPQHLTGSVGMERSTTNNPFRAHFKLKLPSTTAGNHPAAASQLNQKYVKTQELLQLQLQKQQQQHQQDYLAHAPASNPTTPTPINPFPNQPSPISIRALANKNNNNSNPDNKIKLSSLSPIDPPSSTGITPQIQITTKIQITTHSPPSSSSSGSSSSGPFHLPPPRHPRPSRQAYYSTLLVSPSTIRHSIVVFHHLERALPAQTHSFATSTKNHMLSQLRASFKTKSSFLSEQENLQNRSAQLSIPNITESTVLSPIPDREENDTAQSDQLSPTSLSHNLSPTSFTHSSLSPTSPGFAISSEAQQMTTSPSSSTFP
ncbi:hypothetical protein H4Q26_011106 [Puccinia striiformis f. sp. tritici PST-130]|nr:hypothetical protein H4Q26_011106 [Puccinia striiformis f. sp. tritici PST-130]